MTCFSRINEFLFACLLVEIGIGIKSFSSNSCIWLTLRKWIRSSRFHGTRFKYKSQSLKLWGWVKNWYSEYRMGQKQKRRSNFCNFIIFILFLFFIFFVILFLSLLSLYFISYFLSLRSATIFLSIPFSYCFLSIL